MLFKSVSFRTRFLIYNRAMSVQVLKDIFLKSVSAVKPEQLIRDQVKVVSESDVAIADRKKTITGNLAARKTQRYLVVKDQTFPLPEKCFMVGFGKAVLGMATEMEKLLDTNLKRAVVSVPKGIFEKHEKMETKIEFFEGAENNLPDANAMRAANEIKELVLDMDPNDLLIVLISGGGSALLPLPVETVTLEEKHKLIKNLAEQGATINELNSVRKKLSVLKGGGLAIMAHPCRTIALILSDIVGDPLDLVASGPTVDDREPVSTAVSILRKYNVYDEAPESVKRALPDCNSTFGNNLKLSVHVCNFVIGNNRIAAEASRQEAEKCGFQSVVVSTMVEGKVGDVAVLYAKLARACRELMTGKSNREQLEEVLKDQLAAELVISPDTVQSLLNLDFNKDVCLIFAGETTVVVKGNGKGGRNQQLALAFAAEMKRLEVDSDKIHFLSCGTDGIDGPTDAAGAASPNGGFELDLVQQYLENNDAYTFFGQWNNGENLIKIGHTGTNVMDIHVMLLQV